VTSDLNRAATAALDTAGICWTVDGGEHGDTLLAAGCQIDLNYATGLPEIWQVDADADTDTVAAPLLDVHVDPRPAAGPPS
jgi:hypothetical protein